MEKEIDLIFMPRGSKQDIPKVEITLWKSCLPGQAGALSSDPSGQSWSKSHCHDAGIHWPVSHWNSLVEQAPTQIKDYMQM